MGGAKTQKKTPQTAGAGLVVVFVRCFFGCLVFVFGSKETGKKEKVG